MPRINKGSLLDCMNKTRHHLSPAHARIISSGMVLSEDIDYRFALCRDEIAIAIRQIKKVRDVATRNGYDDILEILQEEIEFGHEI